MADRQPLAAGEATPGAAEPDAPSRGAPAVIRTPDQRLRVFVSSTLQELADERGAARAAITALRLSPVLFELGARPHPPRTLYQAYLAQSDIFVGIYWQRYGWVAPTMDISGLEDEYRLCGDRPKLIYVKGPAPEREPRLTELLQRVQDDDRASYKPFATPEELRELIANDLALLLTERFGPGPGAEATPAAARERRHDNLPVQRSLLINRTDEVAFVRDLLRRDDVGVVTLIGPGGTGKTRLALHVAATLRDDFTDGVVFVPLAALADPDLVGPTIAQAAEIRDGDGRPVLDRLTAYLQPKHLLLVLDNFEQVIAAAPLVGQLLAACSRLTVLVTSRSPLRLQGEKEVPVPPLALPDSARHLGAERLSQYAAVQLFIERARDIKPDFAVSNETAPAVAEICYRLDGLPLAIELAAARIKLLPPVALLERLERRLPLLTSGARDVPARQQTLRNTIAWSYNLLDAGEKMLFRRLGVFAGGCTLEAVESICYADKDVEIDALEGVGSLVDKNLLQAREGAGGEPRVAMLATIREYALELLDDSGEWPELHRAHAAFFLALAEEAEPYLNTVDREAWLERLEVEHDNLRGALAWSATEGGAAESEARLAGALAWFWYLRGHVAEGRARLEQALVRTDPSARIVTRAKVLLGAAALAWAQGDYVTAQPRLEESLAVFQEVGDRRLAANALLYLGMAALMRRDSTTARARYEEALTLMHATENKVGEAFVLTNLGAALQAAGDHEGARSVYNQSLTMYRELGDKRGLAMSLSSLGAVALTQGDAVAARALYAEALPLARRTGDTFILAWTLVNAGAVLLQQREQQPAHGHFAEALLQFQELGNPAGYVTGLIGLAGVAAVRGQAERAGRLFGAADALFPASGLLLDSTDRATFERRVAEARSSLDAATFEGAWTAGQAMSLDQAIAEALSDA